MSSLSAAADARFAMAFVVLRTEAFRPETYKKCFGAQRKRQAISSFPAASVASKGPHMDAPMSCHKGFCWKATERSE
jgi:hypothetical protein